jgi:hypothetical protein
MMIPALRLYIKVFLITGIPFASIMTLFDLIDGIGFRTWPFLYHALFFGGLMSLFLVSIHLLSLRKFGIRNMTSALLGVNHKTSLRTQLSKQAVMEKLRQDPFFRKMNLIESDDKISLSTDMGWKSWGEKIAIHFRPLEDGINELEISSKPKLKTTMIDLGKNLQNVMKMEQLLNPAN